MKTIIEAIKAGTFTPNMVGSWDKGGRFYIDTQYHTDSSRAVRTPSRAWPWSEYKHAFTKKYQKQLLAMLKSDNAE